jgi:hypothetical protein
MAYLFTTYLRLASEGLSAFLDYDSVTQSYDHHNYIFDGVL